MKNTPLTATAARIVFAGSQAEVVTADGAPVLRVALPELGNSGAEERLLAEPDLQETIDGCTLFHSAGMLAGFAVADPELGLEAAAGDLYRRVFNATAGRHLYRLWNYVPRINAVEAGLENYRAFCRGRSLAFERCFGAKFKRQLPAACAVGAARGPLAVAFLAGTEAPLHFENPRQIPAFEYPVEYGPRPPSFARATAVDGERGRQIFVSGTAAIRGHLSVAAGDAAAQTRCTIENLRLIGEAAGAGPDFGAGTHARSFKVYLRRPADYPLVARMLQADLLRAGDVVNYLAADICRSDLLVEIDAVLVEG